MQRKCRTPALGPAATQTARKWKRRWQKALGKTTAGRSLRSPEWSCSPAVEWPRSPAAARTPQPQGGHTPPTPSTRAKLACSSHIWQRHWWHAFVGRRARSSPTRLEWSSAERSRSAATAPHPRPPPPPRLPPDSPHSCLHSQLLPLWQISASLRPTEHARWVARLAPCSRPCPLLQLHWEITCRRRQQCACCSIGPVCVL